MGSLGDLGQVRVREETSFGWFGETIRTNPNLTDVVLMDFAEEAANIDENSPQAMTFIKRQMRLAINSDDFDRFWSLATGGGRVRFHDAGALRDERVHVAGYAGHNRLMDGKKLPAARAGNAIPSFVLACYSEAYFDRALTAAGSHPLVTTRALMAPEGYVVEAAARALGDNRPAPTIRDDTVRAYAQWQRLTFGVASTIFSRPR